MRVIDLFCGVGGLSLGAARAGLDVRLGIDSDSEAVGAHTRNFPNALHLTGDLASLEAEAILDKAEVGVGEIDGIIGGPPCQGFSVIGQRSADDARNNLFGRFFEIVSMCKPKFFLAENVPGITLGRYDEIRKAAFKHVIKDYHLARPLRVRASDLGAPTVRERVFFAGVRKDIKRRSPRLDVEAMKVKSPTTVADALKGLPEEILSHWLTEHDSWREVDPVHGSNFWDRASGVIPVGVGDTIAIERLQRQNQVSGCFGTRHSATVQARYGALAPGSQDKISKSIRLRNDGLCPTLRAGTGPDRGSYQAVRPIHPKYPRVITPREAARLQGFPDWFCFSPTKWHSFRQIGNSVSPLVSEAIIAKLLDSVA